MEDIQKMIQEISQDVINTALLIAKEMTASKSLQASLKETSKKYDEDDFTNFINGHQYALEDLKEALRYLSGAQMQCHFITVDKIAIEQKYELNP
jgi:hypothetical protein